MAGLREQLAAAGALLGVPITVGDEEEWRLEPASPLRGPSLHVGLGWYAARGFGEDEAVALALLQLWESVHGERLAPERARRRRTLGRSMPGAEPLLAVALRLHAHAELLAAMPALRAPLSAAVRRGLPGATGGAGIGAGTGEQPRHLQWVVVVLLGAVGDAGGGSASLGPGVDPVVDPALDPALDPAVSAEWQALRVRAGARALRRVFAPDPRRTPLQRFERSLALLLPAYERLLALDLRGRGPAVGGGRSGGPDADEPGAEEPDAAGLGDDAAGGYAEADTEASADATASRDAAAGEDDGERARAGEGEALAEGADLFASEQAAFVRTLLETPMPAEGALFEAAMELAAQRAGERGPQDGRADPASMNAGAAGAATVSTELASYRGRAEALAGAIERMREVWAEVIAERVARRRAPGRRALPDGDELLTDSLAQAVTETISGVSRPNAYRRREERTRRTRSVGSTDYVLLIDRSASMSGPVAEAAADAALIMLEALAGVERDVAHAEAVAGTGLELDIRTALIVFDADAHVVKPLSGGMDDQVRRTLHAEVRSPRGATNDAAALAAAAAALGIARGARDGSTTAADGLARRRIVILLSDGGTNDAVAAAHRLRELHAAGVRVHGIGLGSDDVVQRFAPTSRRIDDPREIAGALRQLVRDELP